MTLCWSIILGGLKVKILILLAISALKDCTCHAKVQNRTVSSLFQAFKGDGTEQTNKQKKEGVG